MNRRAYLGMIGSAAVGGCTSSVPFLSSVPTRRVSLVAINSEPHAYDVDLSVIVERATINDDHTAKVTATWENTGETESPALPQDKYQGLSTVTADYRISAPHEIFLFDPDDTGKQPTRSGDCWAMEEGDAPGDGAAGRPPVHLPSGESLTREYRIWDTNPESPCLPPGTYHFGQRYWEDADKPTFSWMFTLEIERGE